MKKHLSKVINAAWSRPIFVLAIFTAALGVFLPELGFYQDDWNHIYLAHTQGASSLWSYFFADARPLTAWVFDLGFRLFGLTPELWQFSSFVLRFLVILVFGLTLEALWPERKREVLWIVLLFSVYPLFNLHAMALAYFSHWMAFLIYLVSLYLMVLALKREGRNTALWVGSGFLAMAHLLTMEYYAGLELLRPIIIFFFITDEHPLKHWWASLKFVMRRWGLYFPALIFFVVYRIIIVPRIAPHRVVPILLYDLLENPIRTIGQLIGIVLQDLLGLSLGSWPETLQYEIFDISRSVNIKALLIMTVCGFAIYIYMKHVSSGWVGENQKWEKQALLFGGGAVLFGPAPSWIVGFQITAKNPLWNSRLGLPATIGLAILIVVILRKILKDRYFVLVLTMLVTISIGWHVRNLNEFRWSWDKQVEFYRQLLWRAPSIEKGTTLMSAGEFLSYMGDYPTAFAVNTIYSAPPEQAEVAYWYIDVEDYQGTLGQDLVKRAKYTTFFESPSSDSIVVQFEPEHGQCLWVLTPENANARVMPGLAVDAAKFTQLERIYQEGGQDTAFLDDLLQGAYSDTQTWCYFYQKGDLAAQFGEWGETTGYWEEAAALGFGPANGIEMLPFIKAYIYEGSYDQAFKLTKRARTLSEGMKPVLCELWAGAEYTLSGEAAFDAAYVEALDLLGCGE